MSDNVADVTVKDNTVVVEGNGSAAPFVVTVKDGVCHVAVQATNGKPFATVKVIDKETGSEVPVNVYTCAEAVVCNAGVPMQIHLQNLYEHAEDEGAHLTPEQKAGLETQAGAQEKADLAKVEAITAASLMAESAKADAAQDATSKAEKVMTYARNYTDQLSYDMDRHMQDRANPHGVTAAQVGLGNVPNKSTNDLQPTYTESSALEQLKSGERLAIAFGKLAKAVTTLMLHVMNKANPHSVTPSQIGAANSSHTHNVSDIVEGAMELDTEYATSEKWLGKIVYVQLVNFGKITKSGTQEKVHGIPATQIVRACGQLSNGMAFPISGGNFYNIGLRVKLDVIEIYMEGDPYIGNDATVQVWYTKD